MATPRSWISAAIVLAVATSPAWGGSLFTPPFPGDRMLPAFVYCMATNVGRKPADVTISIYDFTGDPITDPVTFTLGPGETTNGSGAVGLQSGFIPAGCRFDVASRRSWRASMIYQANPGDPQVIRAE